MQHLLRTSMRQCSTARASFNPPRLTNGWSSPRMRMVASSSTFAPAFSTFCVAYQHSASKNERLAALPRRREPALEEQFVEPRFHRARLARMATISSKWW